MRYWNAKLLTAVLALLIVAAAASAEDAILSQAAARCGKFDADVKDMRMVQVMKTFMPDGDMTFEQTVYIKGQKSRVEMNLPLNNFEGGGDGAVQTVMVNNGEQAWIVSPFAGRKQLTDEEAKRNAPARNCWGSFPEDARIIGEETVDGRDCHIVGYVDDSVDTRVWLDKRNFVPVKGQTYDEAGTEQYRWTHSDFRAISGDWEYPYVTRMFDGDRLAASVEVAALEANVGLADALFNVESVEVQALDLEDLMRLMAAPEDFPEAGEEE